MSVQTMADPFPYAPLGRRLAAARDAQRWSQKQVAAWAEISDGYMGRIETGRNRPDPKILRRLARVLTVEYAELAALAGYSDAAPTNTVIEVPTEKAPGLRILVDLPKHVIDEFARMGSRLYGRATDQPLSLEGLDELDERRAAEQQDQHDQGTDRPADEEPPASTGFSGK